MSSGYLEELSVLYKKQIEDLQQSNRQTTEDIRSVETGSREDKKAMDSILDRVEQLAERTRELNTQQETMITWVRLTRADDASFVKHPFFFSF